MFGLLKMTNEDYLYYGTPGVLYKGGDIWYDFPMSMEDLTPEKVSSLAKTGAEKLEEHKGFLAETMSRVENSTVWQEKILPFWEGLSDADKTKLYKQGGTIRAFVRNLNPVAALAPSFGYESNLLKVAGKSFAQSARRLMMSGMLPPPEGITVEKLQVDTVSDEKEAKWLLRAVEVVSSIVAPEAAPIIAEVGTSLDKVASIGTEMTQESLAKHQAEEVETKKKKAVLEDELDEAYDKEEEQATV